MIKRKVKMSDFNFEGAFLYIKNDTPLIPNDVAFTKTFPAGIEPATET